MRRCSSVEFSPVNENVLLVACDDAFESSSLMEFDLRKMEEPLMKFCEHSEGVIAMSWSRWNDLVVTTNNHKVIVWDMYERLVISEKNSQSRLFDVQWNKTSEDTFFSEGTSARSFVAASDGQLHLYEVDFPLIT
ncbi:protein transport protein Sec31B [Triticum aestivum]|uniref:protein transport protein Sec31B n=2 Tax=Triticum TaxID=4564 RepID=UPI001D008F18|nr:protein transport protein Sec31B-like [Triticum aestivum]